MQLKISDAANIGIHALVYFAIHHSSGRPVSTGEAADSLNVSVHHLSKVLQRLTKAGLVKPVRGPKGGFILGDEPVSITLKRIYEAIEGPLILPSAWDPSGVQISTRRLDSVPLMDLDSNGYSAGNPPGFAGDWGAAGPAAVRASWHRP